MLALVLATHVHVMLPGQVAAPRPTPHPVVPASGQRHRDHRLLRSGSRLVTTEVGRQPWIVWGQMRTADAVNPAPGLVVGLVAVLAVYVLMTIGTIYVLRRMARYHRLVAPQEAGAGAGGGR